MWAKIAKWLLNAVDIQVGLDSGTLTILIILSGIKVVEWDVPLIRDHTASRFESSSGTVRASAASKAAASRDLRQG